MKKSLLILLSVAFILFNFSISLAQPGSLDDTFDGDGKLTLNFGVTGDIGYAVAIQEDGKIVVAGYSADASSNIDFALARFNSDGTLDNSFDMDGKVTTDFSNNSMDVAVALKIQPDGKILAAGYSLTTNSPIFAMARYNTNGSLDDSFGTGGLVTTSFTDYDELFAMALQDDGKILLAGMTHEDGNYEDFAIARYNADGSLDNSFGTGGKILTDFIGFHDAAKGITVQADGKIIAVGYSSNGNTNGADFGLVRYNTDGSFDASFGVGGKIRTDYYGNSDRAQTIVIQPDGKIVVGGTATTAYGYDFALARYNSDGVLDTSFDDDGKVTSSFLNQYSDQGHSVVLQEDGKIILGGSFGSTGFVDKFGMVRYNTDGSHDFEFGFLGFAGADFGGPYDICHSIAIQPDNKIVLAGYSGDGSESTFAIARFLSGLETGILNFSENQSQLLVYPNPIYSSTTLKYSLQKEEIISIDLYDMKGSIVQSFISNQLKPEGNFEEVLNFSNSIPSGYYNLVISNETGKQSIQIVKQ